MYNISMNITELLNEYDLTTNDVRWYLSKKLAYTLLEYRNDLMGLTKLIESGELEADLYNMEEKYLEETQDLLNREKIDEVNIREELNEALLLKKNRS